MQHTFTQGSVGGSVHLTELRQSISRKLIYTITGILLFTHIWITAYWLNTTDWRTWYATLGILLVAGCSLALFERYPRLAHLFWQIGLLAVIAGATYQLQQPAFAIFLILLPLMTVITSGWVAGLFLWGCTASLAWWGGATLVPVSEMMRTIIVLASLISGVIGWVLVSSLFLAIHWALTSFEQAKRNMETAREHRAQLMGLYKNLDQAYYQLERANAALVAAWKTIEEAERFKSEFVANVSHELRTPLNLIVGFSEIMIASPESYGNVPLPGRYRGDLNTIARNAQHLLALVDDVLDLTRIEVGKIALAREDVIFADLVADVAGMLREYVMVKGLDLHINIETGLPPLWIDRLRIRQVLLNLLTNAARHTERGWLSVEAQQSGDEVVVRVTDTGRGILKADYGKIFAQFQSSHTTRSPWSSGAGLGLPISRKFVELHGGRMGVESTYGEGTCFWFTLPSAQSAEEEPRISYPNHRRPLVRLGASERIVVVVHDDQRVVSVLKRYLDGYQVIRASCAAEGVRLAVDVKALALITSNSGEIFDDLPKEILLIQCPLPSSQATAAAIGAVDLLIKPIARHELLAAVDRLGRPIQRALIVDDEPEMVRLCRKMLRGRMPPQSCIEAYNGAEALDILRGETVDLVILDLAMPQIDGRQVLASMAAEPRLAAIPVILISGTGQDHIEVDVSGEICITRVVSFPMGEVIRTLGAVFDTLAPGWQHLNASAPMSGEGNSGTPVLSENPLRPTPVPVAAR